MTPESLLTLFKPAVSGQARHYVRLAGEAFLAPGLVGWLSGNAFTSYTGFGSWGGALAGMAAAIIYLIIRNFFSERRDMWNRFDKIIKDLDARHAAALQEEKDQRHEMANALNRANLAMFHVTQSFGPGGVNQELLRQAVAIYTAPSKPSETDQP